MKKEVKIKICTDPAKVIDEILEGEAACNAQRAWNAICKTINLGLYAITATILFQMYKDIINDILNNTETFNVKDPYEILAMKLLLIILAIIITYGTVHIVDYPIIRTVKYMLGFDKYLQHPIIKIGEFEINNAREERKALIAATKKLQEKAAENDWDRKKILLELSKLKNTRYFMPAEAINAAMSGRIKSVDIEKINTKTNTADLKITMADAGETQLRHEKWEDIDACVQYDKVCPPELYIDDKIHCVIHLDAQQEDNIIVEVCENDETLQEYNAEKDKVTGTDYRTGP